jgi:hypothetical protein
LTEIEAWQSGAKRPRPVGCKDGETFDIHKIATF